MEVVLVVLSVAGASLALLSMHRFSARGSLRNVVVDELVQIIATERAALETLGSPIVRRGPASGSVARMRDGVRTVLSIPICGARGEGTAYVNALRTPQGWSFASLTIHVDRRTVGLPEAGSRRERANRLEQRRRHGYA